MDRYAIVIPSDGAAVLLHCDEGEGLGLETLQALVEGYIETVPTALSEGWSGEEGVIPTLIVNEEGKLMGLPENEAATDVSALLYDYICGNAVLLGARGEELIGFTRKAAENIVKKWRLADDD